jgi:hypothetical protein
LLKKALKHKKSNKKKYVQIWISQSFDT